MKISEFLSILFAIILIAFVAGNSDARTRTISTSSANRTSKTPAVSTEEEEESTTGTVTSRKSGRHNSTSGNVRDSGNVRVFKTEKTSGVIEHKSDNESAVNTRSISTRRMTSLETSGKVRVYKITENPEITTTTRSTNTFNTDKRTVTSDYKPRGGTRVYKTTKNTLPEDDTSKTLAYHTTRRAIVKTPVTKTEERDYHDTHFRRDESIGNVYDKGNVNTKWDYSRRISKKSVPIRKDVGNVRHVDVRRSRHFIHDGDRWERPREHPHRYYYCWRGHWYRFPIVRGHYPRYFYYWNDSAWCRVDRRIVCTSWVHNDYYEGDHVFLTNTVYVPEPTYPEQEGYADNDFITKGESEENLIVKTLTLSEEEDERVGLLLDAEIIQNILASVAPDEENGDENSYEYDEEEGLLIVTAPEELVLKIQTIVQDERTFKQFYNGSGELAVDVISVVSPVFLEKDYNEAARLGEMNYVEIHKLLRTLDSYYRSSGKKCWYNESIGTITVVDDEENLYRAWDYMNKFPYIPRDFVY